MDTMDIMLALSKTARCSNAAVRKGEQMRALLVSESGYFGKTVQCRAESWAYVQQRAFIERHYERRTGLETHARQHQGNDPGGDGVSPRHFFVPHFFLAFLR